MQALADVSKMNVPGSKIADWALEEGEEEADVEHDEEYQITGVEVALKDGVDVRCQTDQNVLIRRMENSVEFI